MRGLLVILLVAGCTGNKKDSGEKLMKPIIQVAPVTNMCVTKGAAKLGAQVTEATMRAFAHGSSGDAASLTFIYRGEPENMRALASGQDRRQLGLKLRAANGCNLVYVMWRLDPKPTLEVSIKFNPGMSTHKECGANGYTKIKPTEHTAVPAMLRGEQHTLRAEIHGDELTAWIDDEFTWRGTLPDSAAKLAGPSGIRSDNLVFDLVGFAAPSASVTEPPCDPAQTD
jgi:hypothetical protein